VQNEEEAMNNTHFREPVTVLVGLGFPREIKSATEAYQLLSDIRLTTSKSAHAAAMKACKAAINGKIDPEIARSTLVAFARHSAMLFSEDPPFSTATKAGLLDKDKRPVGSSFGFRTGSHEGLKAKSP
jgi:hypothetical protein